MTFDRKDKMEKRIEDTALHKENGVCPYEISRKYFRVKFYIS